MMKRQKLHIPAATFVAVAAIFGGPAWSQDEVADPDWDAILARVQAEERDDIDSVEPGV